MALKKNKKVAIRKKSIRKKGKKEVTKDVDLIVVPLSKLVTWVVIFAVIVLAFVGLRYSQTQSQPVEIPDGAAVVVNGQVILWEEINARYDSLADETKESITKEVVLNQTVEAIVVSQEVEKQKIPVNDEDLNIIVNRVRSQYSEEGFDLRLQQQRLTFDQFKEQLAQNLVTNELFAQNVEELRISEEEVVQFYENNKEQLKSPEMVRASHILLESSVKADQVLSLVKGGADFAEMAKEHSTGPSAQVGGDLDFFSRGMLLPEFEGAAFNLSVGQISQVVQTDAGYHIIKVTDKRAE